MKIIVVGAGRVGKRVVEQLSPRYEVIVVDRDRSVIDYLNYTYDVLAIHGDGTSPEVLREAGVSEAIYLVVLAGTNFALFGLGVVGPMNNYLLFPLVSRY